MLVSELCTWEARGLYVDSSFSRGLSSLSGRSREGTTCSDIGEKLDRFGPITEVSPYFRGTGDNTYASVTLQ